MGLSLTGYSMSVFWWGLVLILFFSVQLEWLPVSGRIHILYDVKSYTGFMPIDVFLSADSWPALKSFFLHLILPTATLATIPFVSIVRMTRSSVIESLNEDFVRTAKAKGLGFYDVVMRHTLKNALLPVVTVIGFMLGGFAHRSCSDRNSFFLAGNWPLACSCGVVSRLSCFARRNFDDCYFCSACEFNCGCVLYETGSKS